MADHSFRDFLRGCAAERAQQVVNELYPGIKIKVRDEMAKQIAHGQISASLPVDEAEKHELRPLFEADPDFEGLDVSVRDFQGKCVVEVNWKYACL